MTDTGPVRPFETDGDPIPRGRIDEIVFTRHRRLGLRCARPCSDEVFLRRAYIDLLGTLPTAAEARRFLLDQAAGRRDALIDRLLERPEFAEYRAMDWCDRLRVRSEFPINLWPAGVAAYGRWIHEAMRTNVPHDRFVTELLTAGGSCFRTPPANFYRALQRRSPAGMARAVALTFMGARADRWPAERVAGMAAFFARVAFKHTAEWKEEIVLSDPAAPGPSVARYPDGKPARLIAGQDPRALFAAWLTAPANPWFARAEVNRIWKRLLGRGIVHEVDDIRPDNPPSNPELLAHLEREFVRARFDVRPIYRAIMNSAVYQLSAIACGPVPAAEAAFAVYPIRRLEAEVLIDALNQITGAADSYSSAIPEPFTFIPERQRSIALDDGSISSAVLEMFGRPARDTGLDADRSLRPTAAQRLHMLNSSHILRKIERGPAILALLRQARTPRQAVDELYLTILSRYPTDEERQALVRHAAAGPARGVALDLAWALINSAEFQYRH